MNTLIRVASCALLASSLTFPAHAEKTPAPSSNQQQPPNTPSIPSPNGIKSSDAVPSTNISPAAIHASFTEAHIPQNDENSWIGIGLKDGQVAAALNHIFDQTVSDPHHEKTDNPEFFNNIRPIVEALNAHKFTLEDLRSLIVEHQQQEEQGQAEELGPDLTNVIIDSAAKIHHGASPKEIVKEITAQQQAIDTAEKQEQND